MLNRLNAPNRDNRQPNQKRPLFGFTSNQNPPFNPKRHLIQPQSPLYNRPAFGSGTLPLGEDDATLSPYVPAPLQSTGRRNLMKMLPWVLAPLGGAALLGYLLTTQDSGQQSEQDIQTDIQADATAIARSTRDRLNEVKKIPNLVAPDPAVIEFASRAGQAVDAAGLKRAKPEVLEAQASKLPTNPSLEDYLRRTADVGQFSELRLTEAHGLEIAATAPAQRRLQRDMPIWQQAKGSSQAIAAVSPGEGVVSNVEIAKRILESDSGRFLGVVKGKVPVNLLQQALFGLQSQLGDSQTVQVLSVTPQSAIPIATLTATEVQSTREVLGGGPIAQQAIALITALAPQSNPVGELLDLDGDRVRMTTLLHEGRHYALATIPGSNWVAVTSAAPTKGSMETRWMLASAALLLLLAAMTTAAILHSSQRVTHSLAELNQAVEEVASGRLNISITPQGTEEVQTLTHNVNHLTAQLQAATQAQADAMQQANFYAELAQAASKGNNQTVFDLAVTVAKEQLAADRVVIYQFTPTWSGEIVAEAAEPHWTQALNDKINDPCIPAAVLEEYRQGRYVATDDVRAANFAPAHKQLLERLQVKANLVVPVVVNDRLLGLLVAHQCAETRNWHPEEVNFLRDLAAQVGLALSGSALAAQKAAEAERAQVLKDVTLRIRQSLNLQDILELAVEEVRRAIKTDRVLVYRFHADWQGGDVIAESVATGWVKALGQTINDPLGPGDIDRYSSGRIWTTENIQDAKLSDCHCEILRQFQVQANIVAPIITNGKLYGLICGHQCASPRIWQDVDVDLFAQLAAQVGFALDQAALLKRQEDLAHRARQLNFITSRMRESLDRERIFAAAVEETREALAVDRTLVYLFDDQWQGRIVAESVDHHWPTALGATVADPCFAQAYVEKYRRGRVQALTDIQQTELDPCYRGQLEPFQVKANVVAPILVKDRLLGLFVAHQCSGPRQWQETEINFFRQVAVQLGFAIDQANLLAEQKEAAYYAQQLNEMIFRMRETLEITSIFSSAVQGTRETLQVDRAIVYLFDQNWQGTVMAEAVGRGLPPALGAQIADPCFAEAYVEKYRRGRVQALADISKAELDPCYLGQLEPFQVKANIVAPILVQTQLLGLLVVHQCSGPRQWQEIEIQFLRQTATQLGFALEQASLFEQREAARLQAEALSQEQQEKSNALQQQLIGLLENVEGAASGDLTVRADVTVGEIGTVADFFNSIVENLRQIVTQVKETALQVNASVGENEGAMRQVSDAALKQAEETALTLQSIADMTDSIRAVADSAQQAAEVARLASGTAEAGGTAMDLTVQNILNLRETIGETAKKVKRLGESSQEISKVVSLINQIAAQTNMLAINAGIEAARAGEEGQGFAIVAEEVGELANRSAAATQEIAQIVQTIQRETSEVVEAMEQGTTQVVEGTHLVENAKHNLENILRVSRQIDDLAQMISNATASQVETSETIANLMQEIAYIAGHTSKSSRQVSTSLHQTVAIAQALQESVEMFKVN
jgi:methyl-accepting chemotaxis protein PixJ